MARFGAAITLAGTIAVAIINCTEKTYINQPITDSVHIRGTVYAWRCGPHDLNNNPYDSNLCRFSVVTGESAIVTFVRDNGFASTVQTDDSSSFELRLSAGAHRIVVRTGYSWPPDTFSNVQLVPGDTSLSLDVVYCISDPLNMVCLFSYLNIADTASASTEWEVIRKLNRRSYRKGFPVFNLSRDTTGHMYRRLITSAYTSRVYVEFTLPIYRTYVGYGEIYNVCEARSLLQRILDTDSTSDFPENFSIYPRGLYPCALSRRTDQGNTLAGPR